MSQFNLGTVSISAAFNDAEARAAAQKFYKDVQQQATQASAGAAVTPAQGASIPGAVGTIHPAVAEQEARRAAVNVASANVRANERRLAELIRGGGGGSDAANAYRQAIDAGRATILRVKSQDYEEREAGRGLRSWDREVMGREARVDRSFDAAALAQQKQEEKDVARQRVAAEREVVRQQREAGRDLRAWDRALTGTENRVERSFDAAALSAQSREERQEAQQRRRQLRSQERYADQVKRDELAANEEVAALAKDKAKYARSRMTPVQQAAELRNLIGQSIPGSREEFNLQKELDAAEGAGGNSGFWGRFFGRGGGGQLGPVGRFFGRLLSSPRGLAATAGAGAIAAAAGSILHQQFQMEDVARSYRYGGAEAGLQSELAAIQSRPGGVFGRALRRIVPFGSSDEQAMEAVMGAQQSMQNEQVGRQIYLNRLGTAQTITELGQRANLAMQPDDFARTMLHASYQTQRFIAEREIGAATLRTQLVNTYDPDGSNSFELTRLRRQIKDFNLQTPELIKAAKSLEVGEQRHALFVQSIQNRESVSAAREISFRMQGRPQEAMDLHFKTLRALNTDTSSPGLWLARLMNINAQEGMARFEYQQGLSAATSNLAISEDEANWRPRSAQLRGIRDRAQREALLSRMFLGREAGRMRLAQGRNEIQAQTNQYMLSLHTQAMSMQEAAGVAFGAEGATRENLPGLLQFGKELMGDMNEDNLKRAMQATVPTMMGAIADAIRAAKALVN